MLDRAYIWWDSLRTAIWPVPVGMALSAVLLYTATAQVTSSAIDDQILREWWLHRGDGEDARNLLSTLVTAIITMSSVVFSMTIVALSLAANQFGSRLIRVYISNLRSKLALGLFMATTVYCLLGLGAIEASMSPAEVPHVAVTVGSLLAFLCVFTLLFFLHDVARSMVADEVIRRAATELEETIDQLDPLTAEPEHPGDIPAAATRGRGILVSREEGYVEAIEYDRLLQLCVEHDFVIRLEARAGTFMCKEGWLGAVEPISAATSELSEAIQSAFLIGSERTPTQDLEFSIRHLVDIALRALSPGINDANTALVVIDRLRGSLSRLMGKALPSAIRCDASGRVRVVGQSDTYGGVLDAALHQIRQAAAPHPSVIIELLRAIGRMAEHVRLPEQQEALARHAELLAGAGLRGLEEPRDRVDIEEQFSAARSKLAQALEFSRTSQSALGTSVTFAPT